jgi:hypothetical protein
MKLHFGKTKNTGWVSFRHTGYRLVTPYIDEFVPYKEPRDSYRKIKSVYGISNRFFFLGIILYGKESYDKEKT